MNTINERLPPFARAREPGGMAAAVEERPAAGEQPASAALEAGAEVALPEAGPAQETWLSSPHHAAYLLDREALASRAVFSLTASSSPRVTRSVTRSQRECISRYSRSAPSRSIR